MGGTLRVQATTMKNLLIIFAALVAVAFAGSSYSEPTSTACAEATGSTAAMWTEGLGSTACTIGSDSKYYKGSCNNGKDKGTYTITGYSDSACTTTDDTATASALSETSLPTTAYSGYTIKSCGACP